MSGVSLREDFNPGRKEKERGWLTFCVDLNVQSVKTNRSQQILLFSRLTWSN